MYLGTSLSDERNDFCVVRVTIKELEDGHHVSHETIFDFHPKA